VLIEVAETHPPANDKKLAKVKAKTGEEFGIWFDKLGLIQVGQRPYLSQDHQGEAQSTARFSPRRLCETTNGGSGASYFLRCALGLGGLHRAWPAPIFRGC
jgi:hypothetical protein